MKLFEAIDDDFHKQDIDPADILWNNVFRSWQRIMRHTTKGKMLMATTLPNHPKDAFYTNPWMHNGLVDPAQHGQAMLNRVKKDWHAMDNAVKDIIDADVSYIEDYDQASDMLRVVNFALSTLESTIERMVGISSNLFVKWRTDDIPFGSDRIEGTNLFRNQVRYKELGYTDEDTVYVKAAYEHSREADEMRYALSILQPLRMKRDQVQYIREKTKNESD